ncbi:MAG: hypothetical protein KIPDCIKN_00289 [Haliscomenobacter sp.]|nr:hypothetical protein [Haliscomenobacter sp.]
MTQGTKRRRWVFCLWFFCWSVFPGLGQSALGECQIIAQKEGFPVDQQHAFLFQDAQGFLWVSSLSALHRFDGTLVKTFLPDSERMNWLLPGYIQHTLLEDRQGRLWVSNSKDIFYYHPSRGRFFRTTSGQNNQEYRLLHADPDGRLWGLKGGRLFSRIDEKMDFPAIAPFSEQVARFAVQTDARGFLQRVIGTPVMHPGIEVLELDGLRKRQVEIRFPGDLPSGPSKYVERVFANGDTLVWLCTNAGLAAFNPDAPERITSYPIQGLPNTAVTLAIPFDSKRLVVGTREAGVWVFDKTTGEFEAAWGNEADFSAREARHKIESALADPRGEQLWLSFINRGLGSVSRFSPDLRFLNQANGIPLGDTKYSCPDPYGGFWLAGSTRALHLDKEGACSAITFPDGLQINTVWNFLTDHFGRPWVLAGGRLFYRPIHASSWKEIAFLGKREVIKDFALLPKGKILVLTDSQAFFLQESELGVFGRSNPVAFIRYEMKNAKGPCHLFAPMDGYLFLQEEVNSRIVVFKAEPGGYRRIAETPMPLVNGYVWDRARETVWLATTDGLKRLSKDFKTAESHFSGNEWLKHAEIKGVLLDEAGRLWLAAPDALVQYEPDKDQVLFFRQEELRAGPFLPNSAVATSDGRFIFGAKDGIISFDPKRLKPHPVVPKPYIYEIQVNGAAWDSLDPAVPQEVFFKSDERRIRLTLSAVGHYLPSYIRIQYRLEGYDNNWVTALAGENVHYILKYARSHTFQMRAIGPNGQVSAIREWTFTVHPPWWYSVWSVLVVLGVVAGLSKLEFNRVVRKKVKEEQKRQKLIEQEWSRMMNDLHDGIGFDLTAIRAMSERGSRNNPDPEAREQFEKIYRRALDGMQSMGEIFRVTEDQAASLDVFLEFLRQRSKEYLDSMGLEHQFLLPQGLPYAEVGAEQRQNVWLVLKESLNNTAKHAQATLVQISVWKEDRTLFLRIQDDGCGFDPSAHRSGRGTRNMPKRMRSIGGSYAVDSSPQKGTTILLSCPLKTPFRPPGIWNRLKTIWRRTFFPDV